MLTESIWSEEALEEANNDCSAAVLEKAPQQMQTFSSLIITAAKDDGEEKRGNFNADKTEKNVKHIYNAKVYRLKRQLPYKFFQNIRNYSRGESLRNNF